MSKTEIRRHRRIPYFGRVRISWEDSQGRSRYAAGRCLDISEDGLRVELSEPIPLRSNISVQAEQVKLSGSAIVKHVARQGSKYWLGLELSQVLLYRTLTAIREAETTPHPVPAA